MIKALIVSFDDQGVDLVFLGWAGIGANHHGDLRAALACGQAAARSGG
jgi:hypothetical protein